MIVAIHRFEMRMREEFHSEKLYRIKYFLTINQHNDIVVLMIPDFEVGGNLPPGVHPASWSEFVDRFGGTPHRQRLMGGLRSALKALKGAGCKTVYLDGSFTTRKPDPGDFDGCWEIVGVDSSQLDPVLLSFDNKRAAQKAKYLGEMFPTQIFSEPGKTFLEFFQIDKQTGEPKGIIVLDLEVEDCD